MLYLNNKDSFISTLKDPFTRDKMTFMRTYCFRAGPSSENWVYMGAVGFENGKTSGEQKFEADSYNKLMTEIEEFIKHL